MTWRLYLDGQLDGEAMAGAMPRADSIQHFAIGAAMNSMGIPAGAFHGAIDEVRVWGSARPMDAIARTMFTGPLEEGLIAHWRLDEEDAGAPDGGGDSDGTIVGATFVRPGAVLNVGTPPVVMAVAPVERAVVMGTSVDLSVSIADDMSDAFAVTFHVREITEADDFTIAVLPDTQYYTEDMGRFAAHFYAQTQWIMENREAYAIAAVIHNGDIVEHGDDFDAEWRVADMAMGTLEEISAELPDGLPYIVTPGNHDQEPIGTTGNTVKYNQYFGVDRFEGRAYYGGHYADDNDENWITFAAGGMDFLIVSNQYDTTPDPAVLSWARGIYESHPDHFGIFDSHYLVNLAGNFGPQGQATYDALRDVDNLHIMTSGHIAGEARRSDTYMGHEIHSMLADYQGRMMGGNGWMRLWEFSPANDEITVRTYSPSLDMWETDAESEFTLSVDLAGAGGELRELVTIDPAGATAVATWSGLAVGGIYEWYATVTDCAHTVRTPLRRFTTVP
jgi:hypothetical protein